MISSPRLFQRAGVFPPAAVMTAAVVAGLAVVGTVLMTAHSQPWLGLELGPSEGGALVVESTGPAAGIPPGAEIAAVSGNGDTVGLRARDLVAEPDGAMGDYGTYNEFLNRQDRLARAIASGAVRFSTVDGSVKTVAPDLRGRPLSSFPADFWVQLVVGVAAWLVSATVFAFRPHDAGSRYLLLSGVATLLFSPAAALYSTRELALGGTLFRWANDLNFFGGSLFAASFVALLLHYPRRLGPAWVGIAVVALYIAWFVAQQAGMFHSMTFARRFLVLAGVAVTFALAGIHWFRTRRKPVERAALQWFLLSWMLGTSLFALFILLPQMFRIDTSSLQGYSFLLFLLIYAGLAFGILRYRLFELGVWWRRIASWTLTVLMLVLIDMVFLFGLKMSPGISLSITLVICGVVWLPLRTWAWSRFRSRRETRPAEWFGRVMDVALAPGRETRDERWRALLDEAFSPLAMEAEMPGARQTVAGDGGLSLAVAAAAGLPGYRLEYAAGGRRLFSPQDAALAGELVRALDHVFASRSAYETGVAEERGRIARDIHDNIGAQLLAALHSKGEERKDAKIRESLDDLRSVINGAPAVVLMLDEAFGELRMEAGERLAAAGIALRWQAGDCGRMMLDPPTVHALRSVFREAVSNVVRHSGARNVSVSVDCADGVLRVGIEDDGSGFPDAGTAGGNGLANMRTRLEQLGGTLELAHPGGGTRVSAHIPLPVTEVRTS